MSNIPPNRIHTPSYAVSGAHSPEASAAAETGSASGHFDGRAVRRYATINDLITDLRAGTADVGVSGNSTPESSDDVYSLYDSDVNEKIQAFYRAEVQAEAVKAIYDRAYERAKKAEAAASVADAEARDAAEIAQNFEQLTNEAQEGFKEASNLSICAASMVDALKLELEAKEKMALTLKTQVYGGANCTKAEAIRTGEFADKAVAASIRAKSAANDARKLAEKSGKPADMTSAETADRKFRRALNDANAANGRADVAEAANVRAEAKLAANSDGRNVVCQAELEVKAASAALIHAKEEAELSRKNAEVAWADEIAGFKKSNKVAADAASAALDKAKSAREHANAAGQELSNLRNRVNAIEAERDALLRAAQNAGAAIIHME